MGGLGDGWDRAASILLTSCADFMLGATSAFTCCASACSSLVVIACRFIWSGRVEGAGTAGLRAADGL